MAISRERLMIALFAACPVLLITFNATHAAPVRRITLPQLQPRSDMMLPARTGEASIDPVDEAVGARIRLLRKRRKISQEELGKAIGVTFQQVQKYENGKNRVGASRLHLVAIALDVPISELFDGTSGTSGTSRAAKSVAFDPQALRFAEAFVKISDKELRSSLVDLVEAMAPKFGSRN